MPAALKVKGSVMARLFDVEQAASPLYGITTPAKSATRNHLQIEFAMGALAVKSARYDDFALNELFLCSVLIHAIIASWLND